jgi:hypothetical protein
VSVEVDVNVKITIAMGGELDDYRPIASEGLEDDLGC